MKSGKTGTPPASPAAVTPPQQPNMFQRLVNPNEKEALIRAQIAQLVGGVGGMTGAKVDYEADNERLDKAREAFKKKQAALLAEENAGWTPVVTKGR